jgi:DNA-binding NarL/FixJ family response regulator
MSYKPQKNRTYKLKLAVMKKINVMIVEDQVIFRSGLKLLLADIPELQVIDEAANGKQFLDIIKTTLPDVVLMDIKMSVMDGIEATKAAMKLYPELKVLVISMFGEEEYLVRMLECGIRGFLLKNANEDELKKAILMVNEGKNYFSHELLPALANSFMKKKNYNDEKQSITGKLTKRELEILNYICKGYTNKEIAEACFISHRTAGGHRANLLEKTGCKNTAELVGFGLKYNLISS